ncbi:RICIN domain-containing protein [Streptomyces sp. HNM0663]|uniref:RICIN domain-containing protein n=1 Tax=Streptomyces chengmaiensis TaxID=3040919 RepID=A0ABT6HY90_9ACTN|nr:RICIN domain-containing protein [Streptomyces chengmaiensis]MDH2393683.1 RICIN domain-containing protein [Streptomyces chengmaiensis]
MRQQGDGTTPPGPAVRRASVLPAVAAEPDGALDRPSPASGLPGDADGAGDGPAAVAPASGRRDASPEPSGDRPATQAGNAEGGPEATAGRAGDAAAVGAAAPGTAGAGASAHETGAAETDGPEHGRPETPEQAGSEPESGVVTLAQPDADPPHPESGRKAQDEAGPPRVRPAKPLLAAAAIAGTVLVAVPLLFIGGKADNAAPAGAGRSEGEGGTTLQDGGPGAAQGAGRYAAVPPSTSASPSTSTSTSASPSDSPSAPSEGTPRQQAKAPARPPASSTTPAAEPSGSPSRKAGAAAGSATGRSLPQGATFRTVTDVLIKNVMTGMCVDIPNYGKGALDGPVNQFPCARTGDNQLWDLVVADKGAGPSGADLFTIRNGKDGYCLDLPGYGGQAATTSVSEWYCNGTAADNQLWYLDKKATGKFWIRNHASGNLCLDVAGYYGVGGRDARLTIFHCDLKDDQLWSFS